MASKTTTNHGEIRRWAESHGGKPACVAGTGGKHDVGMLRVMFPGSEFADDANLRELTWEDWLDAFDANELALVFDPASRFNKLVGRDTAERREAGEHAASRHHGPGR